MSEFKVTCCSSTLSSECNKGPKLSQGTQIYLCNSICAIIIILLGRREAYTQQKNLLKTTLKGLPQFKSIQCLVKLR